MFRGDDFNGGDVVAVAGLLVLFDAFAGEGDAVAGGGAGGYLGGKSKKIFLI